MSSSPQSPKTRRDAARARMRRYREAEKHEKMQLEAAIHFLEEKLKHVQRPSLLPREGHMHPHALATQVLLKHTKSLRTDAEKQRKLAQVLYSWVASQEASPSAGPRRRASWTESTLLADPIGREHGFQWLSAKVYHTAARAIPHHPFGSRVEDRVHVVAHPTEEEDDAAPSIASIEEQVQCTVFANYACLGKLLWTYMARSDGAISREAVEGGGGDDAASLCYCYEFDPHLGVGRRNLLRLFEESNRITVTSLWLHEDERYPLLAGEYHAHGCGWMVFEHIANDVTLVRHSRYQSMPMTSDGSPMPLTAFAARVLSGSSSTTTPVEAVCSAVEGYLTPILDSYAKSFVVLGDYCQSSS
ncbi:Aste57867_8873 [Aphanomyces stellatus]|uniref:Aste57867_8873 protein n=1 Tax=Aphanomyces stellatus TaxID=120398 RepID=A0A485KLS7_9STRA|nr:hypothetical protein As57867_008838 [Aphanomyces stellatus]VFT85759.1 Aste57867_8873 [Aphanomyces stellatus]